MLTLLSGTREGYMNFSPALVFHWPAWQKLMLYVEAAQQQGTEINGFGFIQLSGGHLVVAKESDIFITQQTVAADAAEASGSGLAHATYHAVRAQRQDQLRLQWHSHPGGVPRHSRTDMNNIHDYGAAGMSWFVSLVLPIGGHPCARIDSFASVDTPFHIGGETEVYLAGAPNSPLATTIGSEIAQLVTIVEPEQLTRRAQVRR